ncbi:hypothetical protein D081_1719 [Anaerovibrio sp. JC8]|uniref:hypothetical protein n=1 Tax=Anaerovibrio sp. JC8 TaxID=1240085 RepID=UPI000A0CB5FD|nr:hypothetical protein [Anaerovibrio sp. JC8]ORT99569.1 hypothetical protein D081_1719 [Anaerovibrio sp. JC8]
MLVTGNDRGSISVMAVILVFTASVLVAAMESYNSMEHRLVDKIIAHRSLGLMAEEALRQEYERLRSDSGLMTAIVNEHRPLRPYGNVLADDRGRCEVFVGERKGYVIIWAVAEKGRDRAQAGCFQAFDEAEEKFVLKGMF